MLHPFKLESFTKDNFVAILELSKQNVLDHFELLPHQRYILY